MQSADAVQEYSVAPKKKMAGAQIVANGTTYLFKVAVTKETGNPQCDGQPLPLTNDDGWILDTDGYYYDPSVTWTLTKGATWNNNPGWASTEEITPEATGIHKRFQVTTGNPNKSLNTLVHQLKASGK